MEINTRMLALGIIAFLLGSATTFLIPFGIKESQSDMQADSIMPGSSKAEAIAQIFAMTRTYDIENYNCMNFSNDLVAFYESAGYNARVISGWHTSTDYCAVKSDPERKVLRYWTIKKNNCLEAHEWVAVTVCDPKEIFIEATTGRIIDDVEIKGGK